MSGYHNLIICLWVRNYYNPSMIPPGGIMRTISKKFFWLVRCAFYAAQLPACTPQLFVLVNFRTGISELIDFYFH